MSNFTNLIFFFFNDTATTEIYTLSLHDALPICGSSRSWGSPRFDRWRAREVRRWRSEEHTSELQSQSNLVCRLLLEKKKKKIQADRPDKAAPDQVPPHPDPTVEPKQYRESAVAL